MKRHVTKYHVAAYAAGLLFGAGLGVAGMTLPARVVGFLDVTGDWDPTLAFVMAGAVLTYGVLHRLIVRRPAPLFAEMFRLPTRSSLDRRLLVGAALFGVGWGLGGFCPGPAITSVATGAGHVVAFVVAMSGGMYLFEAYDAWSSRRARAARRFQGATAP